ncbi:hypothetical protein HMPREF9148_02889 [Prevotella sp. F0091]|nr:hypothetical protein HMPREF9148_02889 [Prevotella sp. F0091]
MTDGLPKERQTDFPGNDKRTSQEMTRGLLWERQMNFLDNNKTP